uniref:protein LLP homolog n=1 Tax=Myxine glutinosa TaxID=7769 RepID=UPI00358FA540
MAKGAHCKWKRKMRAAKRKRYAPRELSRLKATLGKLSAFSALSDIARFTGLENKWIKKKPRDKEMVTIDSGVIETQEISLDGAQPMQTEEATQERETKKIKVEKMESYQKRNPKTMLDQNGHYPIWMNPRQCKRLKRKRLGTVRKGVW